MPGAIPSPVLRNVRGSAYDDELTGRSDDTDDAATGNQGSMLWGLGGDDTLEGSIGNDTLEGGAGADELDGGFTADDAAATVGQNTQMNTLSYAGSDAGVRVNLAEASASGGHADGDEIETYDFMINTGTDDEDEIEVATFVNLTGSAHDDHLTGDGFANHLAGGGGDDSLRGAAGADILGGGPGADMLDGGEDARERNNMVPDPDNDGEMMAASEDWAAYRGAEAGADGSGVTVNIHTGRGTAGDAMGDELKDIELYWGSKDGDDTFIASAGADIIHGDGGSDTVSYESSRHAVTVVLTGNTSAPLGGTSTFSPANPTDDTPDTFNAATDGMLMFWRAGGGDGGVEPTNRPDPVEADDGLTTTKSYAEGDVLASIENVTGSRRDDMITGDLVTNVLKGGAGDDTLNGDAGNDTLYGGDGEDILGARDTDNSGTFDLDEAGNDMLMGGADNDTLNGGTGNDTLNGGGGDNDLRGGEGADVFVFTPGDDMGSDEIFDFSATTAGDVDTNGTGDKIDLSAFNIDPDDMAGLLTERGSRVIVNLEDYGGGRITIHDATKEGLMEDSDGEHLIHDDMNMGAAGVGEDGTDGIFIL